MSDPNVTAALERGNNVVFFDVTLADLPLGRVRLELFTKVSEAGVGSPIALLADNVAPRST